LLPIKKGEEVCISYSHTKHSNNSEIFLDFGFINDYRENTNEVEVMIEFPPKGTPGYSEKAALLEENKISEG
jgi:hypothetical protein